MCDLGFRLGFNTTVEVCSLQCSIMHQALQDVVEFLNQVTQLAEVRTSTLAPVIALVNRTRKLVSSCENDENWIVNGLLFEDRSEQFQAVHTELYECIELVSLNIFHKSFTLDDKSLVHQAYSLCMANKYSVEDMDRAAGMDRAELLDKIDQKMRTGSSDRDVLLKLKDLLELRGRVSIDHEKLAFKRHIGHGISGSVYEVTWLRHPFAVKVFQKGDNTFARELEVLSLVKHPNILPIAGQSYNPETDEHMLVMKKMDMDLASFLSKRSAPLETSTLLSIVLQVATAMAWLHARKIIHRDLKPQNVLVECQEDNDDVTVRVADFGLARTGFITSLISGATSRRGTKNYMAPEVWTSESYSKKADVYSFAMLCYQVVSLQVPFQGIDNFMEWVVHGALRPTLSDSDSILTELITQCWKQDPSERPDFSEVCYKLKMIQATYLTGLPDIKTAKISLKNWKLRDVIDRLWRRDHLNIQEVGELFRDSKDIFLSEPTLLDLMSPITVCGDILGQFANLLEIFRYRDPPPETRYLFLGNYVDYRKQDLSTICLLLAYKIKYPNNIFLLRGNGECSSKFYCQTDTIPEPIRIWRAIIDCVGSLPLAALIDNKILCMHGGPSPELESLDQIRMIDRPTDIPNCGLLRDLLWSQPSNKTGYVYDKSEMTLRRTFNEELVSKFVIKHDLELICRGGQAAQLTDEKLVTLRSVPNDVGDHVEPGVIMNVNLNRTPEFIHNFSLY